jgi:hypothetical protein
VEPALTIAWARPSATSRAAATTEACGRERTAGTASSSFAIQSLVGTTSMPGAESSPSTAGLPKTRRAISPTAASRAPAAITSGPPSAPKPSSATRIGPLNYSSGSGGGAGVGASLTSCLITSRPA